MKIGILGGTGLIGSLFTKLALEKGHSVRLFSRSGKGIGTNHPLLEVVTTSLPTVESLENLDAVINLVGEPIAGVRWTEERKAKITLSRVEFTRGLVSRLSQCQNPPRVLLQGSAVGYYGMTDTEHQSYAEDQSAATDYLAKLCQDWETETIPLKVKKVRVVLLRTGIVLSKSGGALAKMLLPFLMGVGGVLGTGKQGMSWIHEKDMVQAMFFLLENEKAEGAVNMVSPKPVSNREFTKTLGKVLKRPTWIPTPTFAIDALFGEGAVVVLKGQYIRPGRLLDLGFTFQFSDLELGLRDILNNQATHSS